MIMYNITVSIATKLGMIEEKAIFKLNDPELSINWFNTSGSRKSLFFLLTSVIDNK